MSLQSWKAKFYPIEVEDCPIGRAVEHSLTKWVGLREHNLVEHQLHRAGKSIVEMNDNANEMFVMAFTCALCHYYNNDYEVPVDKMCIKCPIVKIFGAACDDDDDGVDSKSSTTYGTWSQMGDPEPMIKLLHKCRINEIAEECVNRMDVEEKLDIRSIKRENMIRFHHSAGQDIRNNYELWSPESPLTEAWQRCRANGSEEHMIDGVDHHPNHPDAVSGEILDHIWLLVNSLEDQ